MIIRLEIIQEKPHGGGIHPTLPPSCTPEAYLIYIFKFETRHSWKACLVNIVMLTISCNV